jgi:hypothetical protein
MLFYSDLLKSAHASSENQTRDFNKTWQNNDEFSYEVDFQIHPEIYIDN